MSSIAVLVPVKAFAEAKGRLAAALDAPERAALAEQLATATVRACEGTPVTVVCEDPTVAAWAESVGAQPLMNPTPGLDHAIRHGVKTLQRNGVTRVLITHADLAHPEGITQLFDHDGVVLVPDRHLGGTNVMVIPTDVGFTFSYGPGSFARHLSEAERTGLPIHVIRHEGYGLDLDEPEDLALFRSSIQASADRGPAT